MEGSAVLEVDGVAKRYGDRLALDGVTLAVAPGEVCGLLGPNGAGKTTLVSIIAGLRRPDAGHVRVAGIDVVGGGRAARAAVGLAAQETGVYPTVTVRANLELFAGLAGLAGAAADERLAEVADLLELDHLMDRQARALSGGEKRRLHTAMAMVHRPPLLMLDEPTTGVDIATRSRLLAAISRLVREEGGAVLYSTHYLPEVTELGASVAILDGGRIRARGPLDRLIAEHSLGLVELTFDGPARAPAPALTGDHHGAVEVDGSVVRVTTDQHPGPLAARLVGGLGADADRLVSVDLTPPSLETVFLSVTGRAYAADGPEPDGGPADERQPAADDPEPDEPAAHPAVARHDLRILKTDPGFLIVFTVSPLAFMAFSTRASGAALEVYLPGSDVGGAAFIVPGATVVFSGFLVGNVGFGVFREHGWRTWERLRASPLSGAELMAGKSVVPLLCLAFQLTALLGGGALLFGLEVRGSWTAFLAVAVVFGIMQLALGFMLLAVCRSVIQLNAISTGGAMLIGGLAGAITPLETLPGWAQAIAPFTPAYWAMRGFRSVTIDSGGLSEVLLPLGVLAGFTLLFAAVALRRFDLEDAKVAWA